jgi:hypothetical protein
MPRRSEVALRCGRREIDGFYPLVKSFLERDRLDLVLDGQPVRG